MENKTTGMHLRGDFSDSGISRQEIESKRSSIEEADRRLLSGQEDYTGWVKLPLCYDSKEIEEIEEAASQIRKQCQALVIVGIGGSYLGARAAIEMLKEKGKGPEIYFAGQNISADYHGDLMEELKDKEICVCVISKSGTTTEPAIAFALLKDMLIRKYGKNEASSRIYAITDKSRGVLREEANREGYKSFVVPDDVGGRYSVLTAVGLLPIAVAGIDIKSMLTGAAEMAKPYPFEEDDAAHYAAVRNLLWSKGKSIEVFESYEPKLFYFAEWLKQLFGESEGKEGKGVFPAALQFSTDLHSMGQFLQDGNRIFFETVLNVENPNCDLIVPEWAGENLAGLSMNKVNKAAVTGVMSAHRKAGIPMIRIDIPALEPYYFGQMVYFFERACALSCYLSGVNPFDQPGVENYKEEMRNALKG
ncbi:glucose-6-phosphate isomerase [Bacillota bacterium]